MDRFRKHISKQVDRWRADHDELLEALIDIDAGRITDITPRHRADLESSIEKIAQAIASLEAFNRNTS